MPDPPRGEADLRALSERFSEAEQRIRALIARAASGDRRSLLREALITLVALRGLDFRTPVLAAYLASLREAGGGARARTVRDLAGSLAQKLDGGVQTAEASARDAFRVVTEENLEVVRDDAVTAHVDDRGTRWPLDAWAEMNTQTIGRQASTRGSQTRSARAGR